MASSSVSSIQTRFKYDLFLSFRGEDTRKTFVDHLYYALQQQGIHTFKDDKRLKKGKRVDNELIKAIEDSKFFVIVFSKNYASSSWCLDELVKIIECHKTNKQVAYPLFYDVEPTEVRKQIGAFGEAFAKHKFEESFGKWREALMEAANLAGWELKNIAEGHEAEFIKKVVKEIFLELCSINFSVDEKLVGIESRIKDVELLLEIGFDDVRMVGIKGMGGGGKTTLARALFDKLSFYFEGKSFVENVREVSQSSLTGLKSLQKQVISDVLNDEDMTVNSVYDGKNIMKKMLSSRKVLFVLDDVDHIQQLEALAGDPSWFMEGSRIIITTRDEQLLVAHGVKLIHNVNLLSDNEATCLFNWYAFRRDMPIHGYEELSRKVVRYVAGLPLTAKVLGSFLCCKNELEWIDALKRLETVPEKETAQILELSYIGLEEDYKQIFLNVACFMDTWRKDEAIIALESCGFHPRTGLKVLEQKSLITISYGYIDVHDLIKEMSRNIVRRLNPDEPNTHSRLWIYEEIKDIITNDLGTQATKYINLGHVEFISEIFMKGFGNFEKLIFLCIFLTSFQFSKYGTYFKNGGSLKYGSSSNWMKIDQVRQYIPNSLRYLLWDGYHLSYLPKSFVANNLVALRMRDSNIKQLWGKGTRKVLKKLKFMDLTNSMLKSLDLKLTPNLERLDLRNCKYLEKLSASFGCLLKLKSLSLSYSQIRTIDLRQAQNLEVLDLEECHDLVELHFSIECPELTSINLRHLSKLRELNLGLTPTLESIKIIHSNLKTLNLGLAQNLEELYLEECPRLVQHNALVGCVKDLECIDLSGYSRLKSFDLKKKGESHMFHIRVESIDVCPLDPNHVLPKFQVSCLYEEQEQLSSTTINLQKLVSLVNCCIRNFMGFSETICGLQCLRQLTLNGSIPEMPKHLEQLEYLEKLVLSSIESILLPVSICLLKHLKSLKLESCLLLEKLPEDIGQLCSLEELILNKCTSLTDIPISICNMKCLKEFNLIFCTRVEKLPEELGGLEGLEELNVKGKGISRLPNNICMLKPLKSLKLASCLLLEKLPEDIGRLQCLEKLIVIECTSLTHIPVTMCKMKKLKEFNLAFCTRVEKLPEELGCLECLEKLNVNGTGIIQLPKSISLLKGLHVVGSISLLQSCGFASKIYLSDYSDEAFCYVDP